MAGDRQRDPGSRSGPRWPSAPVATCPRAAHRRARSAQSSRARRTRRTSHAARARVNDQRLGGGCPAPVELCPGLQPLSEAAADASASLCSQAETHRAGPIDLDGPALGDALVAARTRAVQPHQRHIPVLGLNGDPQAVLLEDRALACVADPGKHSSFSLERDKVCWISLRSNSGISSCFIVSSFNSNSSKLVFSS